MSSSTKACEDLGESSGYKKSVKISGMPKHQLDSVLEELLSSAKRAGLDQAPKPGCVYTGRQARAKAMKKFLLELKARYEDRLVRKMVVTLMKWKALHLNVLDGVIERLEFLSAASMKIIRGEVREELNAGACESDSDIVSAAESVIGASTSTAREQGDVQVACGLAGGIDKVGNDVAPTSSVETSVNDLVHQLTEQGKPTTTGRAELQINSEVEGTSGVTDDDGWMAVRNRQNPARGKPPVIIVPPTKTVNMLEVSSGLTTICEGSVEVHRHGEGFRISLRTFEDWDRVIGYLKCKNVQFHTYTPGPDRPLKIVISGLPTDSNPELVSSLMSELDFGVRGVGQLTRVPNGASTNRVPTGSFVVVLARTANVAEVYNLKYLGNVRVWVRHYEADQSPKQCYRCQNFGHSSNACNMAPRCVKCGGGHRTQLCTKLKETAATCCNCKENHPASYRGCSRWNAERDMLKNQKTKRVEQKQLSADKAKITTAAATSSIRDVAAGVSGSLLPKNAKWGGARYTSKTKGVIKPTPIDAPAPKEQRPVRRKREFSGNTSRVTDLSADTAESVVAAVDTRTSSNEAGIAAQTTAPELPETEGGSALQTNLVAPSKEAIKPNTNMVNSKPYAKVMKASAPLNPKSGRKKLKKGVKGQPPNAAVSGVAKRQRVTPTAASHICQEQPAQHKTTEEVASTVATASPAVATSVSSSDSLGWLLSFLQRCNLQELLKVLKHHIELVLAEKDAMVQLLRVAEGVMSVLRLVNG